MRKELYKLLCDRLQAVSGGAIKHIDLWNHNVEFIEQEELWSVLPYSWSLLPIQWRRFSPVWNIAPSL